MPRLLSSEKVESEIGKYGYTLISNFTKSQESISISDKEGYRYTLRYCSIMETLKNNRQLERFNKFNLSSLYNIYLWVQKEVSTYEIIGGEYVGSKEKTLSLMCKICGETWADSWESMYFKQACPYCSKKRISSTNNLAFIFPNITKEWDYLKNKLNPEDYFPKSDKLVFWICGKCCLSYETRIASRTQMNSGCPLCNSSKGEAAISNFLESNKIIFFSQHRFSNCKDKNPLPFDFYIPEFNMCIEYQGEQHYRPVSIFGGDDSFKSQIKRDKIKKKYCKLNRIDLLIIPYWEIQNVEKIIIKRILQKGGI